MSAAATTCAIVLAEDNPADAEFVRHALREHGTRCGPQIIDIFPSGQFRG